MDQDWSSHKCKKDGFLKYNITYGTTILGENDVTFRTSIGEFVRGGKRMQIQDCDDWRSNLNTFHKGSNVARKMDVWVQKELKDSQHRGCTVSYKEENVYIIYVKQRETRSMRCHCLEIQIRGVVGWVQICKTGEL